MKRLLIFAVAVLLAQPTLSQAQTTGTVEDVQIRSVDFSTQVLELFNNGSSNQALDGWRFCTHDETDGFDYTSSGGLNGITLGAGSSLSVHWANDATGPDAINVSSLGGAWIDDLTVAGVGEGISLNLYRDSSFGSTASIVDHVQYSYSGANIGGPANPRGGVAVGAGLWGTSTDWIPIESTSTGLILSDTAFPGATGNTHTSSSYSVSSIPEPSALLLFSVGAAALSVRRRRIS